MNRDRIGIDLIKLDRVQLKESFINMVLTSFEREELDRRTSDKKKIEYLAGRFAAKEAIFKVTQDKGYLSYSVLHDDNGCPYVAEHPELSVSISHDGDYAVAIVLKRED